MSQKSCCVPGCLATQGRGDILHRFPNPEMNAERFKTWILNIGGEITSLDHCIIYDNRRVCHKHFEDIHKYPNKRLSKLAIPVLHMPGSQSQVHDEVVTSEDVSMPPATKSSYFAVPTLEMESNVEINEFKTIDTKNKKLAEVRKYANEKPEVMFPSSQTTTSFQSMEVDNEIAESTTSTVDKLSTRMKLRKEVGAPLQTVNFMTLKSFSKLLMSSSPSESIEVSAHTVKSMIPQSGRGPVIDLEAAISGVAERCGFTATVMKVPQVRQPGLTSSSNTAMARNIQVKEIEKKSAYQIAVDSDFVMENMNLLADSNEGVSEALVNVTEIQESEFEVAEFGNAEVNAAGLENCGDHVAEVEIVEVKLPESVQSEVAGLGVFVAKCDKTNDATVNNVVEKLDDLRNSKDKQGLRYATTEAPPGGGGSQASVPLFTGPIDRSFLPSHDFNKLIDNLKIRQADQKSINNTIDAAKLYKLPDAEAERMRSIIKSYHERYLALKHLIRNLKKQSTRDKKIIRELKNKISAFKTNSKGKAFEKITSNMTEDAKTIIRMQVMHHKKKPRARRFSLKEKLFSLALYKLSRQAYRYVSSILAMPTVKTLDKLLNDLYTKLLVNDCTTHIISHQVKDDSDNVTWQEADNVATTNINSQEHDETAAAVAAIINEIESQGADISLQYNENNNDQIEYIANQATYPNVDAHGHEENIESGGTNRNQYINEVVFTKYADQVDDQSRKILQIPSNYGTISIGYSESTQQIHQYPLENLSNLSEIRENIIKLNEVNAMADQSLKEPKSFVSTMSEDKKQKIDFILSKLMTPDQLKNVYPKPQKKTIKKYGNEAKKKIRKPNVEKSSAVSNTRRASRKKNNAMNKIMKPKRNFKTIPPVPSPHAQTNPMFCY